MADPTLPGLDALAPATAPPAERGADAVVRYVRAQVAEENRRAGMSPRPGGKAISDTQRRTMERRALIDAGFHPLTRLPLADNGETCGTCNHLLKPGRFRKCDLVGVTRGPGTDVQVRWPACVKWEAADE